MRIAYFFSSFPKLSETFVQREVRKLKALGLDPVFIANRPPAPRGFQPNDVDLIKRTFYLTPIRIKTYVQANLKILFKHPRRYITGLGLALTLKDNFARQRLRNLAWMSGAAVLTEYLFRKQVSHVHVHFAFGAAGVAIFLKTLSGIPYSLSIHGSDVLLPQPLTEQKLKNARFIISNCQFHIQNLRDRFASLSEKKFFLIRIGIDLRSGYWAKAKPCTIGGPLRILNVARLHPVKDQIVLIKACVHLKRMGVAFRLRIVGEGPMRQKIEAFVNEKGLENFVDLMGTRYESEVAKLFDWAHVLTLSSKSEGTPMTVIEAMAKARPVIVPDITALPEMVLPRRTGYLFERGSSHDLANKLTILAENPDLINKMGKAGRKRAEALFDLTENTKDLLNIFTKEVPTLN
jgi:glycosyltransferase involved in cell wall biosynthesis